MDIIFILGATQAFFLPLLIFNKKNKSRADFVLASWFILMALALLSYYLEVIGKASDYPIFLGISTCFAMLFGPMSYVYVLAITRKDQPLKPILLLHGLPYVVFTSIVFYKLFINHGESIEADRLLIEDPSTPIFMLMGLLRIFLGPIYLVISLMILQTHTKKIKNEFSYTDKIDLKWLRLVILAITAIWFTVIVANVLGNFNDIIPMKLGDDLIYLVMTITVFFGGFHGIKQQVIFSSPTIPEALKSAGKTTPEAQYAKSSLTKEDSLTQLKRLLEFMEESQPYLDGKLSLNSVAQSLGISGNHLSQVINENLNKNFFDFVNGYRVEIVKQKLADPANRKFTLLAIAYDCGFSSKSSFNEVFKKFTQLTPSQYLKQLNH